MKYMYIYIYIYIFIIYISKTRVIGNKATAITPCHSEYRNTKMTQPLQLFYESLRDQQNKRPS